MYGTCASAMHADHAKLAAPTTCALQTPSDPVGYTAPCARQNAHSLLRHTSRACRTALLPAACHPAQRRGRLLRGWPRAAQRLAPLAGARVMGTFFTALPPGTLPAAVREDAFSCFLFFMRSFTCPQAQLLFSPSPH